MTTGDGKKAAQMLAIILVAAVVIAALFGVLFKLVEQNDVEMATEPDHDNIESVRYYDGFGDRFVEITANQSIDGDYIVLLEDGEQVGIGEKVTAETSYKISISPVGPPTEIVIVEGGQTKSGFFGEEHTGGEVVERIKIDFGKEEA